MYTCWHSNLAQLCTSNLAQPYEFSMALTIKSTHTHNLNGHTAHAASIASRSQAYTLPQVDLLALLSASPTSGIPSPQFPSTTSGGLFFQASTGSEAKQPAKNAG